MYLSNILNLLDIWYVENRGKVIGRRMNLTERELDVLACILIGKESYKSVGELLNISHSTVGTHLRRSFNKTNCKTRLDLKLYIGERQLKERYYRLTQKSISWYKSYHLGTVILVTLILFIQLMVNLKLVSKNSDITRLQETISKNSPSLYA